MNSEISTLRKNFDRDYFTFESLAYYGFTPNFSAKYGWKQFIKDYFVVYSDQELLTSSTYGGSIYADALAQYIDNAYTIEEIYNKMVNRTGKPINTYSGGWGLGGWVGACCCRRTDYLDIREQRELCPII